MDEIHVHKTKKSICAHFAESPCISLSVVVPFIGIKSKNSFVTFRLQFITPDKQHTLRRA